MPANTKWQRVTKSHPCPVCGKHDWCMLTGPPGSPTAAICGRVESGKRCGRDDAGWLHRIRDDDTWQPQRRRTINIAAPATMRPEFAVLAQRCVGAIQPEALKRLAGGLGLSVKSMQRLQVGWSAEHRAFTFPMCGASDNVLGIRLRRPSGYKFAVTGGNEGLFVPSDLPQDGLLLVCEGPTDTSAMLDLGFAAVGRPSCTGGIRLLVELVQRRPAAHVVIVSDNDAHGRGQRGADNLAVVLAAYSHSVCVIAPPVGAKDAREWKRSGATHGDIQAAIDAAPSRRLAVRIERKQA